MMKKGQINDLERCALMLRGYKPNAARAEKDVQNVKNDNSCENNRNNMSEGKDKIMSNKKMIK